MLLLILNLTTQRTISNILLDSISNDTVYRVNMLVNESEITSLVDITENVSTIVDSGSNVLYITRSQ